MFNNQNLTRDDLTPFSVARTLSVTQAANATSSLIVSADLLQVGLLTWAMMVSCEISLDSWNMWMARTHHNRMFLKTTSPLNYFFARSLSQRTAGVPSATVPQYSVWMNAAPRFFPPVLIHNDTLAAEWNVTALSAEASNAGTCIATVRINGYYSKQDLSALAATYKAEGAQLTLP